MRRRVGALVVAGTAFVTVALVLPMLLLVGSLAGERAALPAELAATTLAAALPSVDDAELDAVLATTAARIGGSVSVVALDGSVRGSAVVPDAAVARARDTSVPVNLASAQERRSVVPAADGVVVDVRVPVDRRSVWGARAAVLAVGATLLLLGTALALWLGRPTIDAAAGLATAATRIADGDLHAVADTGGPSELARVGGALNELAARVRDAEAAERADVAEIVQQLRQPLDRLLSDAESLPRSPVRARIVDGVEVVARTLTAAAGDVALPADAAAIHDAAPPQPSAGPAVATRPGGDLTVIVRERCAAWREPVESAGGTLEVGLPGLTVWTAIGRADGAALVDILLDNALRHTPEGVAISVRLVLGAGGAAALEVADDGPGLPDGAGGGPDTGLGRARAIVEAAGGRLELGRRPGGGAAVRCLLPAER